MTTPNITAAALDAWDAGMSVVRVRVDGTKRPLGEWKQYQTDRAPRDVVERWFTHGIHGLGVICGSVSGDLEMLELEGRFVTEFGPAAFKAAAAEAGLELLLTRLINGFMVTSPSGGRHFYYRVDGEAAPNQKLARRPGNGNPEVLIETRGEGGFVVAPPSSGTVHPSGKSWRTKAQTWAGVPTITVAERDALFDLCRQWNTYEGDQEAQKATPTANKLPIAAGHADPFASSWMDELIEHLRRTHDMQQVLEHYGWAFEYQDRHGRRHFRRPGKDKDGTSGCINTSGRLLPFSTSTPFDVGGIPPTTYDILDVIAAYEYRGDRKTAARDLAERAGIISAKVSSSKPPANVDPTTGEIIQSEGHILGDGFWNARPYLAHIRQAALSRMVAPAAVLGCVLARVAAFTPPSVCLPPLIGDSVGLGTIVALYARSGGGKTTAAGCASALLPDVPPGCIGPLPLGSGEGLTDAYFEMIDDVDGAGKKSKVKRQTKYGALFMLDEGQVLAELGRRNGSTTTSTIRSAWMGTHLGQANASAETKRIMRPGSYSFGLISLWQLDAAMRLLEDATGGTPQRFVWFNTVSDEITVDTPEWPGQLDWTPPPAIIMGGIMQPNPMGLHPDVAQPIKAQRAAVGRGELEVDPLDTHRNLAMLKVAGVLAVLDGRHNVDLEDWRLAGLILAHSDDIRSWVIVEDQRRRQATEEAKIKATVAREALVEGSAEQRALAQAAKAAYRAAQRATDGVVGRRQVHMAMASRVRQMVTVEDAIAEAERLQWLVSAGPDSWRIGASKPS